MFKKIINILGNTILFYYDKNGNAVFRNYCLFKKNGSAYKLELTKQDVGSALEFRFSLDKKLRITSIFIILLMYFFFINMHLTLFSVLWCEFWAIVMIFFCRIIVSGIYSKHLVSKFGEYKLTEFRPPLDDDKVKQINNNFYSKLIVLFIILGVLFAPAFLLNLGIKYNLNSKKPNFNLALKFMNAYSSVYPKSDNFYDMRAYARYMNHNSAGALSDYKKVIKLSGKRLTERDYVRFANLLFLTKKTHSAVEALDVFNEYISNKKMNILDESKMLWIKSIFSIENNLRDSVLQDYNDLLSSLNSSDVRNRFYITCDKAYVLYLMNEYESAADNYDIVIEYASEHQKDFGKELKVLHAERGFTRSRLGNKIGAVKDFEQSGFNEDEINAYEPSFMAQDFVVEKF